MRVLQDAYDHGHPDDLAKCPWAFEVMDGLVEQLEAAQEAAQKNWDEHSERKLAALDRDPERELRHVKEQLESQGRHLAVVLDEKLVTEIAFSELKEQVQSQQEWIDRVAAFSTDAAEAADKAEKERDGLKEQKEALERAYRQACMNLATIQPDLTREGDWTLGEFADLYYDALLDGWGGILGYDRGRKPGVSSPAIRQEGE